MEVGERGRVYIYTYRYTVTTRMTPALRWAAMSHFNVSLIVRGSHNKTVSTNHLFEEKGQPKLNRAKAPLL